MWATAETRYAVVCVFKTEGTLRKRREMARQPSLPRDHREAPCPPCRATVLSQGSLGPQGIFGNVWGHFWLERGRYWHLVGGGQVSLVLWGETPPAALRKLCLGLLQRDSLQPGSQQHIQLGRRRDREKVEPCLQVLIHCIFLPDSERSVLASVYRGQDQGMGWPYVVG